MLSASLVELRTPYSTQKYSTPYIVGRGCRVAQAEYHSCPVYQAETDNLYFTSLLFNLPWLFDWLEFLYLDVHTVHHTETSHTQRDISSTSVSSSSEIRRWTGYAGMSSGCRVNLEPHSTYIMDIYSHRRHCRLSKITALAYLCPMQKYMPSVEETIYIKNVESSQGIIMHRPSINT